MRQFVVIRQFDPCCSCDRIVTRCDDPFLIFYHHHLRLLLQHLRLSVHPPPSYTTVTMPKRVHEGSLDPCTSFDSIRFSSWTNLLLHYPYSNCLSSTTRNSPSSTGSNCGGSHRTLQQCCIESPWHCWIPARAFGTRCPYFCFQTHDN